MTRRFRAPKLSLSVALILSGLGLTAASVFAALSEYGGRVATVGDAALEFASVLSPSANAGLALDTQRQALSVCYSLPDTVYARTRPSMQYHDMLTACERIAYGVATESPSNAFAWLVSAKVAGLLNDRSQLNWRLLLSQLTSPNEQWVSAMRVTTAERFSDLLDERVTRGQLRDIRTLGRGGSGAQLLARVYLDYPASRERIVATIESLAPIEQEHFLGSVKWLAYSNE